jgi:flagellar biogenesis protein FliO
MTTAPFWIQSRMPVDEELRMFHRLQFWRRMSLTLGMLLLAVFAALIGFEKAVIESTRPEFRGTPQVEIMREPAAKKIDNNIRA